MKNTIEVSDSEFQEKVIDQSQKVPVVIDFWAPWCGPCNILSPILTLLSEEYDGKFILAKVNVDESTENARKYNVSSIPAVMMFKDGKVVADFIGSMPQHMVKEWLEKHL